MYYLDTSAFLEWLLKKNADKNRPVGEQIITSDLLRVESHRTFHRLRLENKLNDVEFARFEKKCQEFWDTVNVIFPDERIMEIASRSFPTIVGTLNAIHLSTAIVYQEKKKEKIIFITEDKQFGITAEACGFEVVDHRLQS
jgi:predicted nucleic acid-binding protein